MASYLIERRGVRPPAADECGIEGVVAHDRALEIVRRCYLELAQSRAALLAELRAGKGKAG